ncbi:class I adenylate-forming enzyme family protein [Nocardia mexicana]|uniref:Acyl-CoA synthetase (AMP-forming)/AMP-acid ligase II n=1 Tax=Nocardia mexicana TaxID=279262 RepID=A0A370H2C8_9NOCA|nr:class I adenylate-forming enzyme family protein [Nocardia mexicana]RDI49987.1 acyl-CoA synthetase (AMP-forming)/AMP-acid ligase II [Nocardia mexicana]
MTHAPTARSRRSPHHLGLIFEWSAERSGRTVMRLDRPLDTAPGGGTSLDVEALAAEVSALAAALHAAGARHGDRVVIVKDNHYDITLLAAAAARFGALPVLLSAGIAVSSIRAMIERVRPALVVAGTTVLARAAAEGIDLTAGVSRVVAVGAGGESVPERAVPLSELRGAPDVPVRISAPDEPMVVTHTSGTTGVPKLVVNSSYTALGALPYRLESAPVPFIAPNARDVVAVSLPFAHVRTMSWTQAQLTRGPREIVVVTDTSIPNAESMFERFPATSIESVPNVFQRWEPLADRRPELFAQVRRYATTFDAIHPRTVRKFLGASRRRFPVWAWGLCQSEVGGVFANICTRRTVREGAGGSRELNIGWPTLVGVRVVDPDTGRSARRGDPGIVMVKTPIRCLDYLGESDRHQAKMTGKWWNTGDLGVREGFGRYRLIDREVDMIPGMSCIELESTLLDRLDRTSEVIVLAVPGALPLPVLCVDGEPPSEAEWRAATTGLPELDRPRIVPWEDLPRTATWKVRRQLLRERLVGTDAGLGTGRWT